MQRTSRYASPLGDILLAADEIGLTGLWFEGQKYYAAGLTAAESGMARLTSTVKFSASPGAEHAASNKLPVFTQAEKWLDIYFSGKEPDFKLPLHFIGTAFQKEVWAILCSIPYGQTMTYGQIADLLAERRGLPRMSAQAVGGAVGHNKISVIVPCHRVVGADGSLTGYAGGIDKKMQLLKLESAYRDSFYVPKI